MNINFSQYTIDELFESLENVDDINHPENALNIYKLLLNKLNLISNSANINSIQYDYVKLQEIGLTLLTSFYPAALLLGNFDNRKDEMNQKISRLNLLLKNDKANQHEINSS